MFRSSGAIKLLRPAAIATLMTSVFGLVSAVQAMELRPQQGGQQELDHLQPTGKGFGVPDPSGMTARNAQKYAGPSSNGIFYHGGPVMLGTVNMYYIYYGAWDFTTDNTNTILNSFGSYIGGTPYFNINTTYYNSSNAAVSGLVALPKTTVDTGSQGSALNDAAVQTIVSNALSSGALPADEWSVFRADFQGGHGNLRLLHPVLCLAHSRHDQRSGHQIWVCRKSAAVSIGLFRPDHLAERQRRG